MSKVKPRLSKSLVIKKAVHPVMSLAQRDFTPNEVFSDQSKKLTFVVGPNMSGKTTYLKTVALIIIMAHMGS